MIKHTRVFVFKLMVNVNKKYLEENIKKSIWKLFLDEIKKVESEKNLEKLLDKFLTPAEKFVMEKRLDINYLLSQGLSYRKIGQIFDASQNAI